MQRASIALAALAALATLGCAPKASNTGDTSVSQMGTSNDRATVQRSIDSSNAKFTADMTKGDVAGMSSVYADDATVFAPNTKAAHGRAEIDKANTGMLSQISVSGFKLAVTDLIISGDYAIESGTYEMTVKPKTGKEMRDVGKFVAVWKKQPDGSWKIIKDIFNTDQPAM